MLEEDESLVEEGDRDDTDAPLNSFFDQNGFSSKSLVKNLGSTFIYLAIYVFGYFCLIVS